MGLGTLQVFVSGLDDPCKVDDRPWFFTIYDCDGRVLTYCGRRYAVLRGDCGRLEEKLPPGCYTVQAVWSFGVDPTGSVFGNHLTDHAIFHVACDRTTCVTLYNPTAHRCGKLFDVALQVLERRGEGVPAEVVQRAREAINEVLGYLPRPPRPLALGHLDEILQVLEGGQPEGNRPKEPAT